MLPARRPLAISQCLVSTGRMGSQGCAHFSQDTIPTSMTHKGKVPPNKRIHRKEFRRPRQARPDAGVDSRHPGERRTRRDARTAQKRLAWLFAYRKSAEVGSSDEELSNRNAVGFLNSKRIIARLVVATKFERVCCRSRSGRSVPSFHERQVCVFINNNVLNCNLVLGLLNNPHAQFKDESYKHG